MRLNFSPVMMNADVNVNTAQAHRIDRVRERQRNEQPNKMNMMMRTIIIQWNPTIQIFQMKANMDLMD